MNTFSTTLHRMVACAMYLILAMWICHDYAYGDEGQADVKYEIKVYRQEVMVGEPVVVTHKLTNLLDRVLETPYRSTSHFAHASKWIECRNERGNIHAFISGPSTADVHILFIPGSGKGIEAGASVIDTRSYAMIRDEMVREQYTPAHNIREYVFLEPGIYQIRGVMRYKYYDGHVIRDVKLLTDDVKIAIRSIGHDDLEILGKVRQIDKYPKIISGYYWLDADDATIAKRMNAVSAFIREHPTGPHSMHLAPRLFLAQITEAHNVNVTNTPPDLGKHVDEYITKYPDSPYIDELLFRLAELEHVQGVRSRSKDKLLSARERFQKLIQQYPESRFLEMAKENMKENALEEDLHRLDK